MIASLPSDQLAELPRTPLIGRECELAAFFRRSTRACWSDRTLSRARTSCSPEIGGRELQGSVSAVNRIMPRWRVVSFRDSSVKKAGHWYLSPCQFTGC
jgi:hypothetical protein